MKTLLKTLIISLLILTTSQAAMQKSGKINIDSKPIEDILNKYYDICETAKADPNINYDRKSLEAMKKLLVVQTDRSASLSACKARLLKGKRMATKIFEGIDMSRKLKVFNLTYDQGTITAFYAYFAYQYPDYKPKTGIPPFHQQFKPIKKADGSIGYLMR